MKDTRRVKGFRRNPTILILLLIIAFLSTNLVISFAVNGCSGSPPVCTFGDSFSFIDSLKSILLGATNHFSDSFHFTDNLKSIILGIPSLIFNDQFRLLDSVSVSITSCPNCNAFSITTNSNNELVVLSDINLQLLTGLVFPVIYILIVMFLAIKLGVKEFPILLGFAGFTFLGLIYVGILPSWGIIFPIIFGSVILSLLISKWLGARGTAES